MQTNVVSLPFCPKLVGGRRTNKEIGRERSHLVLEEVKALREAAKKRGRNGHRDYTIILIMYRHALRASELCELTWDCINLKDGSMLVKRSKNGRDSGQILKGDEISALKKLRKEHPDHRYVFLSERGQPISRKTVHHIIQEVGRLAELPFPVHPHMLRHAKGYELANQGTDTRAIQDYLGHRNITHTVRYTELAPDRLKHLAGD